MSFLASLANVGQFLSGAGGLLGGLGIGRSGGPDIGSQMQFSMQQLQMQEQFQREMAQNSISWRVADAQRAGISPLVALGAPTFNPGALSLPAVDFGGGRAGVDFAGLGKAGANMLDAVNKTMTPAEREFSASQMIMERQKIESNDLDLQIKAAQLAKLQQDFQNPPSPSVVGVTGGLAGQGNVPVDLVKGEPARVTSAQGHAASVEAGPPRPSVIWNRLPNGSVEATPASPAAIAQPSLLNPEYLSFFLRNRLLPGEKPPEHLLPPGTVRWEWTNGSWTPSQYWPGERLSRYRGGR